MPTPSCALCLDQGRTYRRATCSLGWARRLVVVPSELAAGSKQRTSMQDFSTHQIYGFTMDVLTISPILDPRERSCAPPISEPGS